MTIGFYDIDLCHGIGFSLSLPLMKAWARFSEEGHQVRMMKPYEKTGRFNKIFYFKENPNLNVPNKLLINNEKGKVVGYGFYGYSNIQESTRAATPSFFPYDLRSELIKNKKLYKRIKDNSLVDWREKDFTAYYPNRTIIYVNDMDFLKEDDWEDIFSEFKNTIHFVHSLKPPTFADAVKILDKNFSKSTTVIVPSTLNKDELDYYSKMAGVVFNTKDMPIRKLFIFVLLLKTVYNCSFAFFPLADNNQFRNNILHWALSNKKISYAAFLGEKFNPMLAEHYNFYYRPLLQQDPTKITYKDLIPYIDECLTFL